MVTRKQGGQMIVVISPYIKKDENSDEGDDESA